MLSNVALSFCVPRLLAVIFIALVNVRNYYLFFWSRTGYDSRAVEERILLLQKRKMDLARSALAKSESERQTEKLADLKLLLGF